MPERSSFHTFTATKLLKREERRKPRRVNQALKRLRRSTKARKKQPLVIWMYLEILNLKWKKERSKKFSFKNRKGPSINWEAFFLCPLLKLDTLKTLL